MFLMYIISKDGTLSKKDKLIARLKSKPRDFTFDEAKTLLEYFGYVLSNSGKTSGSRVSFIKEMKVFRMHKPHARKELLHYQVNELIDELEGEIKDE
jgi:hypothetical protein